jgi:hypothetical protein
VGSGERGGTVEIQARVVVERRREHAEDAFESERGSHGDSLAPGADGIVRTADA